MENDQRPELRPQPGPQEEFLKSNADIAIYGGAAGSGKSFALLMEALFDRENPLFRAILFRRTVPQLKLPGGLWQTSEQLYPLFRATANQSAMEWKFPSGAEVKLAGLEHSTDRFNYQGAQIPLIMFDELVHFTAEQFWYMLSRCRSMSGVKGRIRAATNPDPDSFVRTLLDWWIDRDSGLPIKSRSGAWRWFYRHGDELVWADTPQELIAKFGSDAAPKSVTFIPASVQDNQILLREDPAYLSNLKALPRIDRERLLGGNWNVRATAGSYFRREWFQVVDAAPVDVVARCRSWDRAATEKRGDNDPDATVGLLLSKDSRGIYYIEHVVKMFASPHMVERAMRNCAEQDGKRTTVTYAQDPGSAGVAEAQATARALDGFDVRFAPVTGDKETRAKPVSAQAEAGNIKLVRGPWNEEFLRELENFPTGKHDDSVDSLSLGYDRLAAKTGAWSPAAVEEIKRLNSHLFKTPEWDEQRLGRRPEIHQQGPPFRVRQWEPRFKR
jgi:predicted phage terminase large subunit-like protein